MNLTARETGIVFRIMSELSNDHNLSVLRETIGKLILELLEAQYFASYVWNGKKAVFENRIALNMSDENLSEYETYYQYRDPITPRLQRRRKTTAVSEVMSRRAFEKCEFFNDFLARDGLHFGINCFAYSAGQNIGDLRIWRGTGKEDFTRRDLAIMDAIGPAFTNAVRLALIRENRSGSSLPLTNALERADFAALLTKREREIAGAVLLGKTDQQIADTHFISITTVRTHLKHIFSKLNITSRTQLMHRIALH